MAAGVAALAGASTLHPQLRLAYNASASAPMGWYAVHPAVRLRTGEYVLARLPQNVRELAAGRGYLPRSVPVLKRIAAMTGQHVCVHATRIEIGGSAVAIAQARDRHGRELSVWNGCRVLLEGELFLLNVDSASSFDSRYFGPLDVSFVLGRATPLLTSTSR